MGPQTGERENYQMYKHVRPSIINHHSRLRLLGGSRISESSTPWNSGANGVDMAVGSLNCARNLVVGHHPAMKNRLVNICQPTIYLGKSAEYLKHYCQHLGNQPLVIIHLGKSAKSLKTTNQRGIRRNGERPPTQLLQVVPSNAGEWMIIPLLVTTMVSNYPSTVAAMGITPWLPVRGDDLPSTPGAAWYLALHSSSHISQ